MGRYEEIKSYANEYHNKSFNVTNVPKIYANLKKAVSTGHLREILLNKKPYRCAFPLVISDGNAPQVRGKDQVSIVFALNLYGARNPGFAKRLNTLMKELAEGFSKSVRSVVVLMRAQMELQLLGISLINFVDAELLAMLNARIKKLRPLGLLLSVVCLFGGAIGCPGFAMIGLIPLTVLSMIALIYGFVKIFFLVGFAPFKEDLILSATQPVGECIDVSEITEGDKKTENDTDAEIEKADPVS